MSFKEATRLANTNDAEIVNLFSRLGQETVDQSFSIQVEVAGSYLLGFGVVDVDKTEN
ncbi:hypothetical protein [Gloeothece verrucosa]|uniref:hypothetical protein n=1 Tax=Gloeothece verrucosa TaxID=2546359 RepID=UPI0002F6ECA5|nr:hypothetical protein [Gloeothece verrucosa]